MVVDDIVTTGATLAAVTARLREVNMQVTGAAVLAATRRRKPPPGEFARPGRTRHDCLTTIWMVPRTRGDAGASAR